MKALTSELLVSYLAVRMPEWRDARVEGLHRLPLGASRETYRFDLSYLADDGQPVDKMMILRRDPPASNVDSDRRHEYLAYCAIYGHGVPVPRMVLLEENPEPFGGAISLAEDLRGYHNSEYLLQDPAWADRLSVIAQQFWSSMGTLATVPVEELDVSFMAPTTCKTAAADQLHYWVSTLDRSDTSPEPITRAAIRELQRWQPVAQKLALVHGDFRAGNFLYDDAGNLIAVLDWEMAHLGDPLEDLAWSMARVFCFGKDDKRSGLAPREEAIQIWEKASGLRVDPQALRWWELFVCVKGQAIWNSGAAAWESHSNREAILAYAAWWLRNAQDRAILELMGKL